MSSSPARPANSTALRRVRGASRGPWWSVHVEAGTQVQRLPSQLGESPGNHRQRHRSDGPSRGAGEQGVERGEKRKHHSGVGSAEGALEAWSRCRKRDTQIGNFGVIEARAGFSSDSPDDIFALLESGGHGIGSRVCAAEDGSRFRGKPHRLSSRVLHRSAS